MDIKNVHHCIYIHVLTTTHVNYNTHSVSQYGLKIQSHRIRHGLYGSKNWLWTIIGT